jgi:hypothetical protein
MEAANLGAYMTQYSDEQLKQAIAKLAEAPSYEDDPAKYIDAAFQVTKKFPSKGNLSLAVPTWAYSNEPTGQFASHVAKYFANSIREDGLLAMGTYGVIFAPGSAGTLQEIFQDTAHNSYKTFHYRAAMVFLGRSFTLRRRRFLMLLKIGPPKTNRDGAIFWGFATRQRKPSSSSKLIPPTRLL